MTRQEKELYDQGWEKRFVIDAFRVNDLVETYESLGFDVLVTHLPSKQEAGEDAVCGECTICFDNERLKDNYRVIFTRKKK